MRLDQNNNHKIIYRIAKNNLLAKKMTSFISLLTILLAVTLVSALALFMTGTKTAKEQILNYMQHVMYMDVTDEQIQDLASDKKTEICVPYKKYEKEFETKGVKYSFIYWDSHKEKIRTYELAEGKEPKGYYEIVVDKAFMDALGKECRLGTTITLDAGGVLEEFMVSGYTESNTPYASYFVNVSKAYANQSSLLKEIPYTALVRLKDVSDVPVSAFTTAVYQMAMDYGIERSNVNTNGKFEQSLQAGNSESYTVILVSILLFLASSIVIYSIFYFSVTSRVKQIGQFQTIGMTSRQVKRMIRREGLLLSLFAIPLGLILGGIISYLLIPEGWNFKNFGITALAVFILGVLIVQISVGKPASIASKISPIEAANRVYTDGKGKMDNRRHKRLTPYTLAWMESRNNRKKWWLTTVSLAFGGVIYMVAASWIASWDEDAYSRQDIFKDSEYYISYLYDNHSSPKAYGITEMQLAGHLGQELEEKIRNIPHVKDIHIETSATGVIEYDGGTFTQPFYPLSKADTEYYRLPSEGINTYDYLAENDAILITNRTFTENLNGITFRPGDTITFRYFDGEEKTVELEIAAVSTESVPTNYYRPSFYMSDVTMKKLWKTMNTAESFSVSVENYEENGIQVEEDLNALLDEYEDLSMQTLKEKKLEDSGEIHKLKIQIYGLSAFIIVFSIFNLFNTVISSILSRRKELSMLESVGMEDRQVQNMLFGESFLLALPNILITLTLGTAAGFGFIFFMRRSADYLEYHFPVLAVLLYMTGMIGIPLIISFYALKKQTKISLVERIRNED